MKRRAFWVGMGGVLLFVAGALQAAKYEIDPAHTEVGFKIRHIVSKTRGFFSDVQGTLEFDPKKPNRLKAVATIKTASVNTHNAKRDEHLRGPDFFNVEKFPEMTFKSKKARSPEEGEIELVGDLTLLGVTNPVTLVVEMGGIQKDPWGNMRVGFSAEGKISRKDFGMGYNIPLDTGGFVIGDEVTILIEVEGIEKK